MYEQHFKRSAFPTCQANLDLRLFGGVILHAQQRICWDYWAYTVHSATSNIDGPDDNSGCREIGPGSAESVQLRLIRLMPYGVHETAYYIVLYI